MDNPGARPSPGRRCGDDTAPATHPKVTRPGLWTTLWSRMAGATDGLLGDDLDRDRELHVVVQLGRHLGMFKDKLEVDERHLVTWEEFCKMRPDEKPGEGKQ